WGDSWAAAWRAGQLDGTESLVVSAPELELKWTVSGLAPVSADHRPSIVALDEERLLVAFVEGTMPPGHNLPDVPRVRTALLHAGNTGEVSPCDPLPDSGTFNEPWVGLGQPTLAVLGDRVRLGWVSARVLGGSAALGQELWDSVLTYSSSTTSCGDVASAPPVVVPTGEAERQGDQRHLAFVADRGLLVASWEDYARAVDPAQGLPDLMLRLSPYQTTCSTEAPCGNGE